MGINKSSEVRTLITDYCQKVPNTSVPSKDILLYVQKEMKTKYLIDISDHFFSNCISKLAGSDKSRIVKIGRATYMYDENMEMKDGGKITMKKSVKKSLPEQVSSVLDNAIKEIEEVLKDNSINMYLLLKERNGQLDNVWTELNKVESAIEEIRLIQDVLLNKDNNETEQKQQEIEDKIPVQM